MSWNIRNLCSHFVLISILRIYMYIKYVVFYSGDINRHHVTVYCMFERTSSSDIDSIDNDAFVFLKTPL